MANKEDGLKGFDIKIIKLSVHVCERKEKKKKSFELNEEKKNCLWRQNKSNERRNKMIDKQ